MRGKTSASPGFLGPKTKRAINAALRAEGFDGRAWFENPSKGYAKAVDVVGRFGIEVDEVVNSWVFRQESNFISVRMAFSNKANILSPVEIKNSRLVISWAPRSNGRYEMIVYMS